MKNIMKILFSFIAIVILLAMISVAVFGCKKSNPVEPIQNVKVNPPPQDDVKFFVYVHNEKEPLHEGNVVVYDSIKLVAEISGTEFYWWKVRDGETKVFTGDTARLIRGHIFHINNYYRVYTASGDDVPLNIFPAPGWQVDSLLPAPDTNKFFFTSKFIEDRNGH